MDDLISRQKVIDTIEKIKRIAENELYDGEVLRTFNDVLNSLINIISFLPQIQPEPKRGKWIYSSYDDESGFDESWTCDKCGYSTNIEETNYCPNCGRDMREE